MVRRPLLYFIGRSSNNGRRPSPILPAEAKKIQYWSNQHPLFVIFFTKITPFLGQEYQGKKLKGCA